MKLADYEHVAVVESARSSISLRTPDVVNRVSEANLNGASQVSLTSSFGLFASHGRETFVARNVCV
jgi:hypothetical protein